MLSLYIFSLIVGGVVLAVAAFGGGHDHHGAVGHGHHDADGAGKILSLRTLTYFLFVFGGVGAGLTWAWKGVSSLLILPLAFLLGIGVAAVVGYTFRYLARSDTGDRNNEDSFVGLQGRVVLPLGAGGLGKVIVHRGNRAYELTARPLDGDATGINAWRSVVVVEMQRGTALVAPLDDASLTDGNGS